MRASTDVADSPVARPAPFDFDAVFFAHYTRITRAIARTIVARRAPRSWRSTPSGSLWRSSGAGRGRVRLVASHRHPSGAGRTCEGGPGVTVRAPAAPRIAAETPDDVFSAAEEQGRVRRVLAALPAQQAEMLLLRSDGFQYRRTGAHDVDQPRIGWNASQQGARGIPEGIRETLWRRVTRHMKLRALTRAFRLSRRRERSSRTSFGRAADWRSGRSPRQDAAAGRGPRGSQGECA